MPQGKFSGLLENRKTPATSEPIEEVSQPVEDSYRPRTVVLRPRAKLAKSKDPSRKNFGFLVKIDTNTEAQYYLKKMQNGQDMSDLVEELLVQWIAKQKAAS